MSYPVSLSAPASEPQAASAGAEHAQSPPAATAEIQVECSRYFRYKPALGRLLAALILAPALPVIGLLALLTRLTSRGPGLYWQLRVGRAGRTFYLYKIRTMRADAEATSGPVWTEQDDPRITTLGRFLRRLHLDELPQLFNVLRGEMALIGPRPERPEFTQYLAREIPGYMKRYAVLPGITGLAQINLPPDSDVEGVRRKLVLDLEYVRRATLTLDLRIMLCTALKLFGLPAMRIAGWLKLWRNPRVPDWMRREPSGNGSAVQPAPTTYTLAVGGAHQPANGACKSPAKSPH